MSPDAELCIQPWLWVFHALDSSSLRCSTSRASDAERFRTAGLSPSAHGFTDTAGTSCEPYSGGRATRSADGVTPSGVSTIDDRRRLAVPPIIDHDSPRRTAAKGSSTRKSGRFVLVARPAARENDGLKQGVAHGRGCDNLSCVLLQPPRLRAAEV
jgi:hypothetical protein